MARSHYIYILREVATSIMLGGWTVKHEMVTWIGGFDVTPQWLKENWAVWRFRDNQPGTKTLMAWEDVL
ncbi:MAG: hypothetical protein ACYS7Y_11705 [Planctomycetota bacterium]